MADGCDWGELEKAERELKAAETAEARRKYICPVCGCSEVVVCGRQWIVAVVALFVGVLLMTVDATGPSVLFAGLAFCPFVLVVVLCLAYWNDFCCTKCGVRFKGEMRRVFSRRLEVRKGNGAKDRDEDGQPD